jgi:cytochrome c oxidase assembly factor CtaG
MKKNKTKGSWTEHLLTAMVAVTFCIGSWRFYRVLIEEIERHKNWHSAIRLIGIAIMAPLMVMVKRTLLGFKISKNQWSIALFCAGIGGYLIVLTFL